MKTYVCMYMCVRTLRTQLFVAYMGDGMQLILLCNENHKIVFHFYRSAIHISIAVVLNLKRFPRELIGETD